jgi:hypothetical protein
VASADIQSVVPLSRGVLEVVVTSVEVLTGLLLTRGVDDIVPPSAVGRTAILVTSTVVEGLASEVMTGVVVSTGIL